MKNNNDQNQKKAANDFLSRIAAPGVLRGKTQKKETVEIEQKEILTEQASVITKPLEESIDTVQMDTSDLALSSARQDSSSTTKKKSAKNQIKKKKPSELKQLSTTRIDTELMGLLKLCQGLEQKSNHDILNSIGLDWLKRNRNDLYQRVLAS